MLICMPQSVCSWDFHIPDTSTGPSALTFNTFTEQGTLSHGPVDYTIHKHGPLSGRWTLEHENQIVAEAHKPSAMFRSFELHCAGSHLTLKARSPFSRSFDILSGDQIVGTISPAHAFTRRATIDCTPAVPELTQLFSFWLATLTWRRASRNSNSPG